MPLRPHGRSRPRPGRADPSCCRAPPATPRGSGTAPGSGECGEPDRDEGARGPSPAAVDPARREPSLASAAAGRARYSPVKRGSRFSHEREHRLGGVARREHQGLGDVFELDRFRHRVRLRPSLSWRLMTASCSGGIAAEPGRERGDLGSQLVVGHDPVHEPDALGLGRVDDLGEERELLGPMQPDEPGQEPRSAEVEREAALGEDLGEARPVGGDDEIAAEREIAARHPPRRRSPLRSWATAARGAAARRARPSASTRPRPRRRSVHPRSAAAGQIGAGTERVARAGDHEHTIVGPRSAMSSKISTRPRHMSPVIAFLRSGRSIVSVTTPSARSTIKPSTPAHQPRSSSG